MCNFCYIVAEKPLWGASVNVQYLCCFVLFCFVSSGFVCVVLFLFVYWGFDMKEHLYANQSKTLLVCQSLASQEGATLYTVVLNNTN